MRNVISRHIFKFFLDFKFLFLKTKDIHTQMVCSIFYFPTRLRHVVSHRLLIFSLKGKPVLLKLLFSSLIFPRILFHNFLHRLIWMFDAASRKAFSQINLALTNFSPKKCFLKTHCCLYQLQPAHTRGKVCSKSSRWSLAVFLACLANFLASIRKLFAVSSYFL